MGDLSRRTCLISLCAWPCLGRGLQDQPTFSADVRVVNVLANVFDRSGTPVTNLEKPDFTLREDRRLQTIRYFTRQTDLPLTLGLLVDTSMSQERVIEPERSASYRFLDQVLRETKDKVFIMQFDLAVQVRQDLTSSYRDLNESLAAVDTPTRRELENGGDRGTLLYDALIRGSQEMMAKQTGRKALIVLTDGEDNGSDGTLASAIEATQKADTLIYSIYFTGSGGGHGQGVLEQLSSKTGGGFFEVTRKQSIDQVYTRIQDELRSQYNLGYVSDRPPTIGEFRSIELLVDRKGLRVQARPRYWATP